VFSEAVHYQRPARAVKRESVRLEIVWREGVGALPRSAPT